VSSKTRFRVCPPYVPSGTVTGYSTPSTSTCIQNKFHVHTHTHEHTHTHSLSLTHTHTVTGYSTPSTSTCIQNKLHVHTHTHEHTRKHTHTHAHAHAHTRIRTHSWIPHLYLSSIVHIYTCSTHFYVDTHTYSTSLCPLAQWLGIQVYFTFICIHTYTLTCVYLHCIYISIFYTLSLVLHLPSSVHTYIPHTRICTRIKSATLASWTGTAHGGDQTENICMSRLDDFLVHCFQWKVLPFTYVKICLKLWGPRENLKTCLKSQGLPWKLVEILAVAIVLIPISSVCGSTPSTFICTYIAHGGDQIQNICISRLDSFPVHSFEWQRPLSTPPLW